MTGFATFVIDVREDLNRGTAYDARIKKAIEKAIVFYRARRYGFNQKTKIFTASAEFTSLTANWLEMDAIYIDTASGIQTLVETNFHQLHEASNGRTSTFTSRPCKFAIQNRLLRFDFPPDQTYSVHMSYLYDLKEISICASDSSSNAWTNEGYELIKTHATVDLLENYIDGPDAQGKALILRQREVLIEKEMKRLANRQQGSGQVTPWF
jgi:hypothetical protein